jgi:hypothetical protein
MNKIHPNMTFQKNVKTFNTLLNRIQASHNLSNDEKEMVFDEITEHVKTLPRERILEALDEAIGNNNQRKQDALFILIDLTDIPEAVERIGEYLRKKDIDEHPILLQTVGHHQLIQFAPFLNEFIISAEDEFTQYCAIHAAGQLKQEVNLPVLLQLTQNCPKDLRFQLTWALKEYGRKEGKDFLMHIFLDNNTQKEEKVIAAWGLVKIGVTDKFEYLVKMLEDLDVYHEQGYTLGVSIRAAQAICDIKGWKFKWHKDSVNTTKEKLATEKQA